MRHVPRMRYMRHTRHMCHMRHMRHMRHVLCTSHGASGNAIMCRTLHTYIPNYQLRFFYRAVDTIPAQCILLMAAYECMYV
jgi:hypothetical protein